MTMVLWMLRIMADYLRLCWICGDCCVICMDIMRCMKWNNWEGKMARRGEDRSNGRSEDLFFVIVLVKNLWLSFTTACCGSSEVSSSWWLYTISSLHGIMDGGSYAWRVDLLVVCSEMTRLVFF